MWLYGIHADFWYVCMWKKEKAKEAAPDLVLELPKEKENSASDSEETVSGMDEATQNEDIPEKKGILIAIDPGHQARMWI